jgi:AmiR/NasT family two-component response regulator
MGSSSTDAHVRDAVVEQARGVLAERFGTDIPTADKILVDVARAQRRSVVDLARAVIESCANGSTPLPQRLYTNANGISDAA